MRELDDRIGEPRGLVERDAEVEPHRELRRIDAERRETNFVEQPPQRVAQHLAPLRKGGQDHGCEPAVIARLGFLACRIGLKPGARLYNLEKLLPECRSYAICLGRILHFHNDLPH